MVVYFNLLILIILEWGKQWKFVVNYCYCYCQQWKKWEWQIIIIKNYFFAIIVGHISS